MGHSFEQAIVGRRGRSRNAAPVCRSRQFDSGVHRMRRRAAPETARGHRRGDAVGADAAQAHRVAAGRSQGQQRQAAHAASGRTIAPAAFTASLGSSSICRPRCPPLRNTLACAERGFLDRDRHALLLPERADAADMVAGQPFGIGRPHHLRRLGRRRRRQLLHADFAIRRHHGADRLAVDLGHQRLQHAGRRNAERFGRLQADARPRPDRSRRCAA